MRVCPAFIDETGILSGSPKQQPVYGIGVMVVPDPKSITNSLYRLHFNFSADRQRKRNSIRQNIQSRTTPVTLREVDRLMQSTRHHEYKFTEVTRFNLQQYVDLLNIYFSFRDVQFHAVIFDRLEPEFNLARWGNEEWRAYAEVIRELLTARVARKIFAILDFQDKPNRSTLYVEDTVCQAPNVEGCLRVTSETSVFMQLVDVLLGCVQFDWRDSRGLYDAASKRANEKRKLVEFIKEKLGLGKSERFLTTQKYREWGTPSAFTISRGNWQGILLET